MNINTFLDHVLVNIKTPSQYIGREQNSVYKDLSQVRSKFCFSFPDTYDLGMSYQGLKLLYEIVNRHQELACERVFAPLPDFIEHLREYDIPLFTLENRVPVKEFHVWGFSISSEINWTNVLEMLDLAKIPVYAKERDENCPIIIAGGHAVYNPEPAAPFLDIVSIGDGEEVLPELLLLEADLREAGVSRNERIVELCKKLPGLYAPNFYDVIYNDDGTIRQVKPQRGLPETVTASYVKDLEQISVSKPLIGYSKTVHNRIFLEIMRGCTRGCRFCQAGMIRRPMRIKSVDTLVKEAVEIFKNTGYEEICLYSLASSDYPYLEELTEKLLEIFAPKGVGITLPSLRINEQLKILPSLMASVRKRGLTLAPEVGTDRMQNIVNKKISAREMEEAVDMAYRQGWNAVKLYFMVGLPLEEEEDFKAIIESLYQVSSIKKKSSRYAGKVTASISNFVPKPNTPFQWAAMERPEKLLEIQEIIRSSVRSSKIKANFHDVYLSTLEALIAKGNRNIAPVIYSAWKHGSYLDGWFEYFKKEHWEKAISENEVDFDFYLHREFTENERLPWHHLDCGVSHDFLWKEWMQAKKQATTGNCATDKCNRCGINVADCYRAQ